MIKLSILLAVFANLIHFNQTIFEEDSINKNTDTSRIERKGQFYFSTKFRQITNYNFDNKNNFDFSIKLFLTRINSNKIQRSKQELISELAFTKYIDSITVVDEDIIEFNSNWEFKFKAVLNTINLKIQSQFTNSYEYIYQNNTFNRVLAKEFFMPLLVSVGTGFNFIFEKSNYINVSLFDFKTTLLSKSLSETTEGSKKLSSKFYYLPEAGISISSSIYKSWPRETFSWRNNSKIFAKGLTKKDITINFKNRFMYEIYKWINISLENQIIYDPLFNYKLQLRNEVVVGVLFKK